MNVLPMLSVNLLDSIETLEGGDWPRGYDWLHEKENQPRRWAMRDVPHALTVRLPSGRSLQHYSKATFITQESGIIKGAELMPLESNVPYQEAIARLEQLFAEWELEPDERAKKAIAQWKTGGDLKPGESLTGHSGYALIRGEDKANAFFQIRPATGGWFLTLNMGLTMDERRKLWGSSPTRPATRATD